MLFHVTVTVGPGFIYIGAVHAPADTEHQIIKQVCIEDIQQMEQASGEDDLDQLWDGGEGDPRVVWNISKVEPLRLSVARLAQYRRQRETLLVEAERVIDGRYDRAGKLKGQ